uniref:Uncharacterized protein n=1 Tax=Candidatus Kentrum sp. LPFa TaxID=2126335 RepID=A0A450XQG4_9GAMM|nr:MAG: hypothetical protein BECKLPF1236A_GA0070988_101405 [Candidatus Kentron sp. LPFa]VFK31561.1 MAG: hypothetical protein BECKLPF1236C_GA0070990_101425 [Candidatus Kentron sp. LPFa]
MAHISNAYRTHAQIDVSGGMALDSPSFPKGPLLEEVSIVDQYPRTNEKTASWQALMRHVQGLPQSKTISEEDIAREIGLVRNAR